MPVIKPRSSETLILFFFLFIKSNKMQMNVGGKRRKDNMDVNMDIILIMVLTHIKMDN